MLRFYAKLQTVAVGKDIIQGLRFDSLQSPVGEAKGWSRGMKSTAGAFWSSEIRPAALGYPSGQSSSDAKKPQKH